VSDYAVRLGSLPSNTSIHLEQPSQAGLQFEFHEAATGNRYVVEMEPNDTIGAALREVVRVHGLVGDFIVMVDGREVSMSATLASVGQPGEVLLGRRPLFDRYPEIRGEQLADGTIVPDPSEPPKLPVDLVFMPMQPSQREEMRRVLSDNPGEFDRVVEIAARDDPELARRMAAGRSYIFDALDVMDRVLDHNCRVKYEQLTPEQQRVIRRLLREFRDIPAGTLFLIAKGGGYDYDEVCRGLYSAPEPV
jgi:hypothetical protein